MKIAVFGWYGHDNAGDERIKYCLNHFLMGLGGIDGVDFYDLHDNAIKGATSQFDDYDLVIIGGGGLILSQHNYHEFIHGIGTKLLVAGISVETDLKGNPLKFAQALLDKASLFLVRDKNSYEKLLPLDKKSVLKLSQDLTFLEPFPVVQGTKNNNILGLNLLPKPKYIKYSFMANRALSFMLGQLSRFGIRDVIPVQDYYDIVDSLREKYLIQAIPFYTPDQPQNVPDYQKNDVNFLKKYCEHVPDVFSDNLFDDCSLLVCMRLHAGIFAVQKAIPFLSFSYLPKNRNFMALLGLENYALEITSDTNIITAIDSLDKNRDKIRLRMKEFTESAQQEIQTQLINFLN
ncbi:MAG: polysaccharide pyruvyl transferase family protein [Candidatus Paracaedibacteraceae bacterium]|nr:polysaccharide pyruvyl transferase family protein [Candidatus Paracaedibacteraceae bacterium]